MQNIDVLNQMDMRNRWKRRGKNGLDAKCTLCKWAKIGGRNINNTLYNGSYCYYGNSSLSLNSGLST